MRLRGFIGLETGKLVILQKSSEGFKSPEDLTAFFTEVKDDADTYLICLELKEDNNKKYSPTKNLIKIKEFVDRR